MIEALWNNADWFWSLLLVVPYLSRLTMFVRLIGVLGPLGPLLQTGLEMVAKAISVVVTYLLKSLWHCLFNPVTWGAIMVFWMIGPYVQPQDVMRAASNIKRSAATRAAPRRVYTTRTYAPRRAASDARSITLRNFMVH